MERNCIAVAELPFYLFAVVLDGSGAQAELKRDVSGAPASSNQAEYVKLTIR